MRDILFRGKSKYTGRWMYGYYAKGKHYLDNTDVHVIFPTDLKVYPHLASILKNSEYSEGEFVMPATIGQYIGYEDKNGKKIFEGDIIREDIPGIYYRTYVITYDGASFCYSTYDELKRGICGDVIDDCEYGLCTNRFEVIGNIHDNPELLKGE